MLYLKTNGGDTMAISTINFFSKTLEKNTTFNLYLPEARVKNQPILFLLHGLGGDQNSWLTNTSLERYARQHSFVIVMPDVGRSYYTNTTYGARYWDYLTQELPAYLTTWFSLLLTKQTTFVAGASMGGYGAFKWALSQPDKIGAAASFSGRLDIGSTWNERTALFEQVFGDQTTFEQSRDNLLNLVADQRVTQMPLIQMIGTNDDRLEDNRTFHTFARQYLNQLDYREQTGGHDWLFWDTYLPMTLQWFDEQFRRLNQH